MTDRTDDHFSGNHNPKNQSPVQRPWRDLAEAVLKETDHEKLLELAQELCDAVDEQVLGHRSKPGEE